MESEWNSREEFGQMGSGVFSEGKSHLLLSRVCVYTCVSSYVHVIMYTG